MNTDPKLLSILACPKCRGDLALVEKNDMTTGLACNTCRIVYRIEDGIPVLLIEEATPLTTGE